MRLIHWKTTILLVEEPTRPGSRLQLVDHLTSADNHRNPVFAKTLTAYEKGSA